LQPPAPLPEFEIAAAAALLRAGGLVAFPTETVYGLGADAANPAAVRGIFALKGRPADHPLIVHLGDAAQVDQWAINVPDIARRLMARFWPGPLTLILPKHPEVPLVVTGGQDSIGLRIPAHPVARQLLAAFGGGLAAPSANRFGQVSPTTAAHVREEFGADAPCILDGGACMVGVESTILSLVHEVPVVLRPGGVTPDMLAEVLGAAPAFAGPGPVRASGTLESHYAPDTPVALAVPNALAAVVRSQLGSGAHVAAMVLTEVAPDAAVVVQMPAEAAAYAHDLYATLRRLDREDVDVIVVEMPPDTGLWQAVCDRLRRAAFAAETSSAPSADDRTKGSQP
jgi:L-threonylcarbamoyladenylate synthase